MNDLSTILELSEEELLQSNYLVCMNYLFHYRQFSEDFLIQTREYYDSWICLKTHKNLSAKFCFEHLYDSPFDSADNFTSYDEIEIYLMKTQGLSKEEVRIAFNLYQDGKV
jgi:hypothetical protein